MENNKSGHKSLGLEEIADSVRPNSVRVSSITPHPSCQLFVSTLCKMVRVPKYIFIGFVT